jgi:hypothetical protein
VNLGSPKVVVFFLVQVGDFGATAVRHDEEVVIPPFLVMRIGKVMMSSGRWMIQLTDVNSGSPKVVIGLSQRFSGSVAQNTSRPLPKGHSLNYKSLQLPPTKLRRS